MACGTIRYISKWRYPSMKELSREEFLKAPKSIPKGAVVDDEFVKVETDSGTAVIINEGEWNILIGAMQMLMSAT